MADDSFRLWQRSDFPKLPAMRWAVKDLIVLGGITLLFGAAKNGKSFVAISIACAVMAGVPWCGFSTRKLRVLYVGAEGFFGLLRREAAWSKVRSVAVELQYFRRPINFLDIASVAAALAALKRQGFVPDLIIIDTLARRIGRRGSAGCARIVSSVLSEPSDAQVSSIIERLYRLRPRYPGINDRLLLLVGELLDEAA